MCRWHKKNREEEGKGRVHPRINNMKKDDSVFYDVPIIFEQGGLKRGLFGEGG